MISLIFLDVDGTLIGAKGHVEDCVWQATEKARAAGVKLSLCTGRPCFGVAQKVAERLGPDVPHIFQNGAQIARASGEPVKVRALKEAATRALLTHAREHNLTLELYTPTNLYVERKTALSDGHAKMIGVTAIVSDLGKVIQDEPVVRAQWVVTKDDLRRATAFEHKDIDVGIATSPALKGAVFASLTQKGVSKGSAVRYVADLLKVDLANSMGVGDSSGDIPLLEEVGFPVAMANAAPELLADYPNHAGHVDECGVVLALESALQHTETPE